MNNPFQRLPVDARILVTGAAGFIGFSLCKRLLDLGFSIHGFDSINDYYDPTIKHARLDRLYRMDGFAFTKADLQNRDALETIFADFKPSHVINLAAQAGVRYSLVKPHAYIESNITGFLNILECCRHFKIAHLIYASSSSVYGMNKTLPSNVTHHVDHPISLYAASKKSNELMAHTYSHLFQIPTTGLRFFTVYGPWGRPDMALFLFARAIMQDRPITIFNHGKMRRDFTYIDDIVEGIIKIAAKPAIANDHDDALTPDRSTAPFRLYNIGNGRPVELLYAIELLERALGKTAKRELVAMQPGDVAETAADISAISQDFGFSPATNIEAGIERFVDWYQSWHHENA